MAFLAKFEDGFELTTDKQVIEKIISNPALYYNAGDANSMVVIAKEDIARAVANSSVSGDHLITDVFDCMLVSTFGSFLNKVCLPMEEKVAFIGEVSRLQQDEEVIKVPYITMEIMDEYLS